jgi:hypothetical protein
VKPTIGGPRQFFDSNCAGMLGKPVMTWRPVNAPNNPLRWTSRAPDHMIS